MLSSRIISSLRTTAIRNYSAAASGTHAGGSRQWKLVSLFVALPGIALCMLNVYLKEKDRTHDRPEFIKYEHLRIRSKPFPWGNGQKTLFHNSHVNALPDGYEEEH